MMTLALEITMRRISRYLEDTHVKRQTLVEAAVFCVLVTLGVGARLFFEGLPNVAPVAAVALFAGYYFRRWFAAFAAPLAVMVLSDAIIGGYSPAVMLTVYAAMTLPVLMRPLLRGKVRLSSPTAGQAAGGACRILGCSVASAVVFFLATNLAVWWAWYDHTVVGLTTCFAAALPFLRFTLMGDMAFAFALFGSYALIVNLVAARSTQRELATETS